MSKAGKGRFCASCQETVVDFSNKTIDEIKTYLTACGDKKVCGRYQARNTNENNAWFDFLNKLEHHFVKFNLRRPAILLITLLLLMSGCYRRTMGMHARFDDKKSKHKPHHPTETRDSEAKKPK